MIRNYKVRHKYIYIQYVCIYNKFAFQLQKLGYSNIWEQLETGGGNSLQERCAEVD